MSEDTLSDTYMMLPSVVNATKKPSRACEKREKLGTFDNEVIRCEGVNDKIAPIHCHMSSSVVVTCITFVVPYLPLSASSIPPTLMDFFTFPSLLLDNHYEKV